MQAKLQSLMSYSRYYMAVVIGLALAFILLGGYYVFHKVNRYENNAAKNQSSQIPSLPGNNPNTPAP